MEKLATGQSAEKKCLWNAQPQTRQWFTLPKALRPLRKSGRKDCKSQRLEKPKTKLSSRHDRPPELPAAMADAHDEVSQRSSMEWEGVHEAPLAEELWTEGRPMAEGGRVSSL